MGLSAEEKEVLERLTKKAEEPDAPPIGKNISFSLDLGNDDQVKRAIAFNLLPDIFKKEEDPNEKKDGGDPPKRQGYFGS